MQQGCCLHGQRVTCPWQGVAGQREASEQGRLCLQLAKQQQSEENGRLRATLQEWSHRNALLESRLNVTRSRWQEAVDELAAATASDQQRAAEQRP